MKKVLVVLAMLLLVSPSYAARSSVHFHFHHSQGHHTGTHHKSLIHRLFHNPFHHTKKSTTPDITSVQ